MESLIFQLLIFAVLFSVGFGFGRYNERKHLAELEQNEKRLAYITVGNLRKVNFAQSGHMISSNVVISHDYFKYVLATVQNFLGGRLTSYESVVDRARREAIVRLKLEAEKHGATHIACIRLANRNGDARRYGRSLCLWDRHSNSLNSDYELILHSLNSTA